MRKCSCWPKKTRARNNRSCNRESGYFFHPIFLKVSYQAPPERPLEETDDGEEEMIPLSLLKIIKAEPKRPNRHLLIVSKEATVRRLQFDSWLVVSAFPANTRNRALVGCQYGARRNACPSVSRHQDSSGIRGGIPHGTGCNSHIAAEVRPTTCNLRPKRQLAITLTPCFSTLTNDLLLIPMAVRTAASATQWNETGTPVAKKDSVSGTK